MGMNECPFCQRDPVDDAHVLACQLYEHLVEAENSGKDWSEAERAWARAARESYVRENLL